MDPTDAQDEFRPLFEPESIAVIGASDNPFKLGFHCIAAVTSSGFDGEVYPVNPRAEGDIQGLSVYPDIQDLPRGIDLYVFALPDEKIVPAVRSAVGRGGRAGVIFAGGFREVGGAGESRQRELVEAAGSGGMKLIGPNCIGVLNTHSRLNATFASPLAFLPAGNISVVSQSGGVGMSIVSQLSDELAGISKFVSIGNRANVDFADMVEYLSWDPETSVICLFIEGLDDARDFLERARPCTRKKPVLACNIGHTERSSRVALSHTGSVSSSEAVYSGAFAQAGLLQANDLRQMVLVAKALGMGAGLKGNGVFLSTHTAGPAIVFSDLCERNGVRFPELRPDIAEAMGGFLPTHSVPANPLDMFAFAWTDTSLYLKAVDLALRQEDIFCAVSVWQSGMGAGPVFPFEDYAELGRKYGKPVFLCLTAPTLLSQEMKEAQEAGVPTYNNAEKAAIALVGLTRWLNLSER